MRIGEDFMKKFLLGLLLSLSLHATESSAEYGISMKMLGHIGVSTLTMETSDNKYKIKMHIQMDKSLSDVEHTYESYGSVVDGIYKPERFTKTIREDQNVESSYYIFDYEKREIQKYTVIKEKKSALVAMFASDEMVVTEKFELITDFTENDTMSTFLNAKHLLNGRNEMPVTSVGFRKNARNIMLHKEADKYTLSIIDKEESDDYKILVSIAPDGLIKDIFIHQYTMLGTISVDRD